MQYVGATELELMVASLQKRVERVDGKTDSKLLTDISEILSFSVTELQRLRGIISQTGSFLRGGDVQHIKTLIESAYESYPRSTEALPPIQGDWRLGVYCMPIIKHSDLPGAKGIVINVYPGGHEGISCRHGVLKILYISPQTLNGQIIIDAADQWKTVDKPLPPHPRLI